MAAVVSSMSVHLQHSAIEGNRVRSFSSSVRSTDSGGGRSLREIEEVPTIPGSGSTSNFSQNTSPGVEEMDEKVCVAVGKEVKESKSTLLWALQNISRDKKIVLVHVHRPAQMIPMMGGKFPASQLTNQQVKAHRLYEREKMNKSLDEYLLVCASAKAKAEKLVIEMDDVAKGLVEVIAQHGISKLVMGAAADKHYSKKMKMLKSKTASAVQKGALPSCNIWFVCKGNLICTREASLDGYITSQTPMASPTPSTSSTQSESLRSKSLSQGNRLTNPVQDFFWHRSRSESYDLHGGRSMAPSPQEEDVRMSTPPSMLNTQGTSLWEGVSRKCAQRLHHSVSSESNGSISNLGSISMSKDEESEDGSVILEDVRMSTPPSMLNMQGTSLREGVSRKCAQRLHHSVSSESNGSLSSLGSISMPKDEESEDGSVILPGAFDSGEDLPFSTPNDELEDVRVDCDMYDQLQEALTEAETAKREAFKESCRRQKAERDVLEAVRKAKTSENLYVKEVKQRKEIEETLTKVKVELEMVRSQRDEIFEELQKAEEQKSVLEIQLINSDRVVKDFEEKLSAAQYTLNSLQKEKEDLQREVDDAVGEVEELRKKKEEVTMSTHRAPSFSEFSYIELEQATHNFDNSLKIGEGGYGSVYKGLLRHTTVAIKMLHPQSMQGRSEFHQEVTVLSKVRHPNLVTLIGACSEAWSLVYEFLPNGSLEDRLVCKDNTAPLPWQVRTRIASEICSALIFLHSNQPHSVVHGDLKPANILLDANLVTKLGDFGISRLLVQSNTNTTLYRRTDPKGTFVYMDPEFLATGELTPRSDVYSFGIILLRLLTGRPALGIVKEVQEVLEKGNLHAILDASAGDWPFVQAQQLTHLALRCCEISRKSRPDLVGEVWRILEPMKNASSLGPSLSLGSIADDNIHIPSYFICPIFQEVMRDPQVAADGYTYEAEALKGWLESGHDTSPMTNLKLPHCNLIPNYALRSAIQEWLQRHHL